MPYATNRDRPIDQLELEKVTWPVPPLNLFLSSGYQAGVYDLVWDDPSNLALNSRFCIYGVNLYRSFDSEYGPFDRITDLPVGSIFWRDQTDNVVVVDEVVTDDRWVLRGVCSASELDAPRYVFRVEQWPIVQSGSQAVPEFRASEVIVKVDGVQARVLRVDGPSGEVELDINRYPEVSTQSLEVPVVPGESSVVTVTYRYNRSYLRTDLSQRVFYRITTVGVPVNLPLSEIQPQDLVETPLEYAAATSNFEIEKLDYIWREAVRRNQWILAQGGERVKAFLRKAVGQACPCIQRASYKQPQSDCTLCFPPGTLVRTELGYRPIDQVQAGDRVLTSDGSFQKVVKLFKRAFEGDLVKVVPTVSAAPILATPEHPFYSLVGHHHNALGCGPKTCGDMGESLRSGPPSVRLLPSGRWWARVGGGTRGVRVSLGTHSTKEEAEEAVREYRLRNNRSHSFEWLPAEELNKGGWLVAQWSSVIEDLDTIEVPAEYRKQSKSGPPRNGSESFSVDGDFLWVVGLYLAEGSSGTRAISFDLHAEELDFQERLFSFFSEHGFTPTLQETSENGVRVVVCGSTLSEWFPAWLGSGCENKHIPEEFMRLPPDKQRFLLQGIYDGDGWKGGTEVTQTSETLALQVSEILHRMGNQPLVRRQQGPDAPSGNPRKLAYCVNWAGPEFQKRNRKGRWSYGGRQLAKIRSVGTVPYEGMVYNLEVEGDHTYVVQGVVVHNCFGTGILGGYEGPYDIIIAPDDGERRVTQKDSGRTVEHSYEVWTGPRPLVSQRDFIVKINGERYSIGAVRMPTNRGMVLQQHFNIGHLDEKDIRYRVPVDDVARYVADQLAPQIPPDTAPAQITDKPNIPNERERRGRTKVWENVMY